MTLTRQVFPKGPGGRVDGLMGQPLDTTKSALEETMPAMVTGALPVLVSVMVWGLGWFAVFPTDSVG